MSKNRRIALRGAYIAVAMVLSYLESLIPVFIFVPGMKLGLANVITVIALFTLGFKDTVIISLGRILLSGILFGNVTMMIYSLAGAALSLIFMLIVKNMKIFTATGVSIVGGIFHNVGQIIVALFILQNVRIIYYLLILFVSGTVTGAVIGVLAGIIMKEIDQKPQDDV